MDLGLGAGEEQKLSTSAVEDLFAKRLSVPRHRVFAIENYRDRTHPRAPEKIDRVALEIITESLRVAERNSDFQWDWKLAHMSEARSFVLRNWKNLILAILVVALAALIHHLTKVQKLLDVRLDSSNVRL